ncbi:hypothetical protein ACW95P_04365 [Candidatus Mycoplasma pogonae]
MKKQYLTEQNGMREFYDILIPYLNKQGNNIKSKERERERESCELTIHVIQMEGSKVYYLSLNLI